MVRWNWTYSVVLLLTPLVLTATNIGDDRRRSSSSYRSRRVIGGTEAVSGQWPYLVNLHGHIPTSKWWFIVTSYADYYCSGSLVTKRWVITAAHCFSAIQGLSGLNSTRKWRVKAGDVNRSPGSLINVIKSALGTDVSGDSGRWWYVRVSKIIIHPDYDPTDTFSWKNDLALIKLSRDLPVAPDNPSIDAVALPYGLNDSWPAVGANCAMLGWGCVSKDGPAESVARMTYLPVVETKRCFNEYGELEDNRICAGYFGGNRGVCKGDSGGPLVCPDGNTMKLAGIVSYTSSVNPNDVPAVFTRITKYVSWIDEILLANN